MAATADGDADNQVWNMVLGHSCRYEVEEFETLAHNLQFTDQKLNYLSDEMASQLGNYGKERKFSPIVNSRYHFWVKLLHVLIQIIPHLLDTRQN